jgi:hypothetical protein
VKTFSVNSLIDNERALEKPSNSRRRANVNGYGSTDFSKGPALHIALTQKRWNIALLLLDKGADPNQYYDMLTGPTRALEISIGNRAPTNVIQAIKDHGGKE